MSIGPHNSRLSPSEELLTPLDSSAEAPQDGVITKTKRRIANLTNGVSTLVLAGTLMGTPALSQEKPVYKQLASNEVMLVAENIMTKDQFFTDAQLNNNRREYFDSFDVETKRIILKYYSEGLQDSPGIDSKGKKVLGGYLVSYYDSLRNTKEYISEQKKGNTRYKYKGGGSLDQGGVKIEQYLTRYGNRFSSTGKQVDDIMLKLTEDETRKIEDETRKIEDETRKIEDLIKVLNKLNQSL